MVTINVIAFEGHKALTLPAAETVLELNRLHEAGKWIYIDGRFWEEDPKAFSEQVLLAAEDVTVTNPLGGG